MSPTTVTNCNVTLDNIIGQVAAAQDNYFAAYGIYFQLLDSHATIPSDATPLSPTNVNWASRGIAIPDLSNILVSISEYSGPSGKGYIIIAMTKDGADTFCKTVNVGPGGQQVSDWNLLVIDIL